VSFELIEDLLGSIKTSHKAEFSDILNECLSYSFIEDTQLAELFDIELNDLEELLDDSSSIPSVTWNKYANKLFRYLTKEKASYERQYYRAAG
jgi:ATP-dependent Clp protease ATP-binding subunit ClpA